MQEGTDLPILGAPVGFVSAIEGLARERPHERAAEEPAHRSAPAAAAHPAGAHRLDVPPRMRALLWTVLRTLGMVSPFLRAVCAPPPV